MRSFKKAVAILLTAMLIITSLPMSVISAFAAEDEEVSCYNCGGTGTVECTFCGGTGTVSKDCEKCENGLIISDCLTCSGTGTVLDEKTGTQIPCTAENCVKGKVTTTCDECKGTGTVDVDCENCEAGKAVCDICSGTGKITLVSDESFKFSNDEIKNSYTVAFQDNLEIDFSAASTANPDSTVSYTSSNPEIASIDKTTGKVKVLGVGESVITASIESDGKLYKKTDIKCTLIITKAVSQLALVSPYSKSLKVGDIFPLSIISNSSNQQNVKFTVESGKEYITLDEEAKTVVANKATPDGQKVVIKASVDEDDYFSEASTSIEFVITKADIKNFVFEDQYPDDILVGEKLSNKVVIAEDDAEVKYEITSGSEFATIDDDGVLTAKSAGKVSVKATVSNSEKYNDIETEYTVNIISENNAPHFQNSTNTFTIPYGETLTNIAVFPNSQADSIIEYKSSNPEVAQVNAQGVVTALKPGNAQISAICGGNTIYYNIEIVKANQSSFAVSNAVSLISYGETYQLETTGAGEGCTVSFETSDAAHYDIVDGALTANYIGGSAFLITAVSTGNEYYNTATFSFQVVVSKKAVSNLSFGIADFENSDIQYSKISDTYKLNVNGEIPDDAENLKIRYSITNGSDIASIIKKDNNYYLQTNGIGSVTLNCSITSDNYDFAPMEYDVKIIKAQQAISFEKTDEKFDVYYGQNFVNVAKVENVNNYSGNDIEYSVSGKGPVKSVDENGAVVFEDNTVGTSTITATISGNEFYETTSVKYELNVNYLDTPQDTYTTVPEIPEDGSWINSKDLDKNNGLVINAPAGYTVSLDGSRGSENKWENSVVITDDGEYDGDNAVNIYLRNTSGAITNSIAIESFKLDATAPTTPEIKSIPNEGSFIDKIKELIFGKSVEFEFNSDDDTSGIAGYKAEFLVDGKTLTVDVDESGKCYFSGDKFVSLQSVYAIDNAGNISGSVDGEGNIYILDNTNPTCIAKYSNTEYSKGSHLYYGSHYEDDYVNLTLQITEGNFYAEDFAFSGDAIDNKSGLITVKKDGVEVTQSVKSYITVQDDKNIVLSIPVDKDTHKTDGEYQLLVKYTDRSGNKMQDFESNIIVIDTVKPVVDISSNLAPVSKEGTEDKLIDYDGYSYYTNSNQDSNSAYTLIFKITEDNFEQNGFTFNADYGYLDSDETHKLSSSDTPSLVTWSENEQQGNVNVASVSLSEEARYVFSSNFTDLAGNEAEISDSSEYQLSNNKVVYDNTPAEISVEYSESILSRILQGITFGIYKDKATVTITAEDNVSALYSLSYNNEVQEGASDINEDQIYVTYNAEDEDWKSAYEKSVNAAEDESTASEPESNVDSADEINETGSSNETEPVTEDNALEFKNLGSVSTQFSIYPQFRGFVNISAETYGLLESQYLGKLVATDNEINEVDGVIVDNKAPEGSLSISKPDLILNSTREPLDFSDTNYNEILNSSSDVTFVYSENSTCKISVYIDEANFNLTEDKDSNVITPTKETEIFVNGELQTVEWQKAEEADTYFASFTLSEEGYYTVTVNCTDLSGNKMDTITKHFAIDNTAPQITSFTLSTDGEYYHQDDIVAGNTGTNEEVSGKDNETTRYDYYFQNTAKVSVTATDSVKEAVPDSQAGVKDIILITRDVVDGWKIIDELPGKAVIKNGTLTKEFEIQGPFKGDIFAIPIDYLGYYPSNNSSSAEVYKWDTDEDYLEIAEYFLLKQDCSIFDDLEALGLSEGAAFVAPYDTIIEDDQKHIDNSEIEINIDETSKETERDRDKYIDTNKIVEKTQGMQRDSVIDFDNSASQAVPLFNNDVNVTLNVKDSYSGIRQVDWYVIGRDGQDTTNNQSGTLSIDNEGKLSNSSWNIIGANNLDNLVYNVSSTITVKNNSNDIIILVVLTDRAGNKSYDYNVIGIDKTAPVIELSYDDANQRTGNYYRYYNHSRTAIITVQERNFDSKYIVASLANTDAAYRYVPNISKITHMDSWVSNGDSNEPIYTYRITYTSNGVFAFNMNMVDIAGNASNNVSDSFTVDLTKPQIHVSLDLNNEVQNGRYFNTTRTATITVVEHNFNQREFENLITASLNGNAVTVPTVSKFINSGADTWVAKVSFASDGDYVLNFKYTDMAGNDYTTVDGDYSGASAASFTIDKTAPVISIDVNDRYGYIDGPVVRVVESDNNCSDITTNMTGTINENGSFSETSVSHSNSSMRQDHYNTDFVVTYDKVLIDGYYTVEASCVDMAGNRSNTINKVFTKNEFGAVYTLSPDLQAAVSDAYVNKNKYFSESTGNIYVDEYSLTPIAEEDSEFYININGKRQDGCISRVEMTTNAGWYLYRYIIDNSKLSAEGLYTLYIRSVSRLDSGEIVNNNTKAKDSHRVDISFTVDNTNPYVRITGLESHINNRTSQKDIKLTVSDNNLYKIKVTVDKLDQGLTTYVWVSNPDKYKAETPDEIVNSFLAEGSNDSSVVEVTFPLSLVDSENSAQYNIRLEVSDLASNYANSANDYNKDEIFTDAYGRLEYLFDSDSDDNLLNCLEFSEITISKSFAIGQMIRDNQPIAIAIFAAIALCIILIIVIPIIVKKRKKLDEQDSKEIE